jgi:ABC-2 type transport system permease protein
VALMIISSLMLHLPWSQVAFFAIAIAIMSVALSGLAVGLGALFPNFKEDNPSKIVSGFGGTLCLVISFIYIALIVALAAAPDVQRVAKRHFFISGDVARGIALLVSLALIFIPMFLGIKRVKNLEI